MALWRNLCFPSVNARVVDGAAIEPTAPMTVVVEGGYIRSAVEDTPQSSSSCGLFFGFRGDRRRQSRRGTWSNTKVFAYGILGEAAHPGIMCSLRCPTPSSVLHWQFIATSG
jgi:hypothetical protein